jgi:hypothetical protein
MDNDLSFNIKLNEDEVNRSANNITSRFDKIKESVKSIKAVVDKHGIGGSFNEIKNIVTNTAESFSFFRQKGMSIKDAFTLAKNQAKDMASTLIKTSGDFKNIANATNDVKIKIEEAGEVFNKTGDKVEKTKLSFGEYALYMTSAISLIKQGLSIVSKPLAQAGQFETLTMKTEVLLGSADKAKSRLKELSNFTKGTSFELPEVVTASNQLQSLGKYSKETLSILSNLAMGSGKSLQDITNAYTALASLIQINILTI